MDRSILLAYGFAEKDSTNYAEDVCLLSSLLISQMGQLCHIFNVRYTTLMFGKSNKIVLSEL